jgi:hypothetical protein
MSVVDRFNQAIQLWIELTATDPNARSLEIGGWDLRSINEEIKESMMLDDSLITTFFMLSHFSKKYFAQRVISVEALADDPDGTMAYVQKMRDFNALLNAPDLQIIGDNFKLTMRSALLHYGVAIERVDDIAAKLDADASR